MKTKIQKFKAVLIITLTNLLICISVFAQLPQKISYQALIRDNNNDLVTNRLMGMQINIRKGNIKGPVVYTETQTPTTDANGLVSIQIGGNDDFNMIDWPTGTYFIETGIAIFPPYNTYTISGTSQLLSVPYSFHSKTAENSKTAEAFTSGRYLGEEYLGGIIFHLYIGSDGQQHGLVVSKTEARAKWQNTAGHLAGADRTDDGYYNTARMTDSPAKTWITGLGTGWYLPSVDELALLLRNRFHVNKTLRTIGSAPLLSTDYHWSSTEWSESAAFYIRFLNYIVNTENKEKEYVIRAVRAF
ncbi:MAG TPA: hypothetical protein PLO24_05205 [Bacteroidales bacterium]|nr:hypothetical protein [Bacteroidales bacterium]